MSDAAEDLLAKLRDTDFVNELHETYDKLLGIAQLFFDDGDNYYEGVQGNWVESLELAKESEGWCPFRSIVRELPQPAIVTEDELEGAFDVYLTQAWVHFDDIYDPFLDYVEKRLLAHHVSPEIKVCELYGLPRSLEAEVSFQFLTTLVSQDIRDTFELGSDDECFEKAKKLVEERKSIRDLNLVLWSANGVSLKTRRIVATTSQWSLKASEEITSGVLSARFEGRATPSTRRRLLREIPPILRSVLTSSHMIASLYPHWRLGLIPHQVFPHLDAKNFVEKIPFLQDCLRTLYVPPSSKDTIDRRIANAVRLLAEADGQHHDAIGLALSVSALDALLGTKEEGLTAQLAQRTAVLLEPDLERRVAAEKYVTALYNTRSRVLHGDSIEAGKKNRYEARALAAGVLYALWFRRDFQHRMGEAKAETVEQFFNSLRDHKYAPGLPMGILELPVRQLWSKQVDKK